MTQSWCSDSQHTSSVTRNRACNRPTRQIKDGLSVSRLTSLKVTNETGTPVRSVRDRSRCQTRRVCSGRMSFAKEKSFRQRSRNWAKVLRKLIVNRVHFGCKIQSPDESAADTFPAASGSRLCCERGRVRRSEQRAEAEPVRVRVFLDRCALFRLSNLSLIHPAGATPDRIDQSCAGLKEPSEGNCCANDRGNRILGSLQQHLRLSRGNRFSTQSPAKSRVNRISQPHDTVAALTR